MALSPAKSYHYYRKYFKQAVPVLLIGLLVLTNDAFGQTGKDIALVLKTIGKVYLNRATNGGWTSAKKGTRLNSGNIVQTDKNALAAIIFTDDKSLLKVRSKSRITIKGKRVQKSIKKTLFMRLGEMWAKVTKGSFYRVETPSGVAAVKGTQFYLLLGEDGKMILFNIEGLIDQFNQFGRQELKAGEVGEMSRDSAPTKRPFSLDELPNWAIEGSQDILEIEFENEAGQKKKMNININRQ